MNPQRGVRKLPHRKLVLLLPGSGNSPRDRLSGLSPLGHSSTALVNPNPNPNPKHGPRPRCPGPSLHGGWLLPACTEHRRLLRSYGFKVNVNIK